MILVGGGGGNTTGNYGQMGDSTAVCGEVGPEGVEVRPQLGFTWGIHKTSQGDFLGSLINHREKHWKNIGKHKKKSETHRGGVGKAWGKHRRSIGTT